MEEATWFVGLLRGVGVGRGGQRLDRLRFPCPRARVHAMSFRPSWAFRAPSNGEHDEEEEEEEKKLTTKKKGE
ncbi:hypothetical protein GW17_00000565 [Ensete ventricosum]|nr:hypothetical protein GW17_00000565 [Ensete ventricosum]